MKKKHKKEEKIRNLIQKYEKFRNLSSLKQ